jgi:hypothetical protein
LSADLTKTDVREDGSFVSVPHEVLPDPGFDCFYVYPTVNHDETPGNTMEQTLGSATAELNAVVAQGAWFRSVCKVYAPFYRQMTIGSYGQEFPEGEFFESGEPFALAYGDVTDAFDHYMEEDNDGRGVVLIGHSQGAHMLTRLLLDRFEDDEKMQKLLISALLVGPLGRVVVPEGDVVGGTFRELPLCQAEDETACIVSFDTVAAGVEIDHYGAEMIPEGFLRACTNPAALGGGEGTLSLGVWYTADVPLAPEEATEPWLSYGDYFSASCADSGALEISPFEDDPRRPVGDPAHIQEVLAESNGTDRLGLHQTDINFALGDLLRIVENQGAAH